MTFLKKLGSIILEGVSIVSGFAPFLQMQFPGQPGAIQVVSKDLAEIGQIVVQVEAVGQALGQPGSAKFQAAAAPIAQVILSSTLMAGRKISDQALFMKGCGEMGGALADILNSLHDNIDTTSKT